MCEIPFDSCGGVRQSSVEPWITGNPCHVEGDAVPHNLDVRQGQVGRTLCRDGDITGPRITGSLKINIDDQRGAGDLDLSFPMPRNPGLLLRKGDKWRQTPNETRDDQARGPMFQRSV